MTTIPEDAQRLADRLRALADELESAARYGVPIPPVVTVDGFEHGGVTFHADPEDFDAWADYTEADVTEYDRCGQRWHSAAVDVNGLSVRFSTTGRGGARMTTDAAEDYWEQVAEDRAWDRRHRPLGRGEVQARENTAEREADVRGGSL